MKYIESNQIFLRVQNSSDTASSPLFFRREVHVERERERERVNRRSSRQILFRKIGLPLSPLAKRQWQSSASRPTDTRASKGRFEWPAVYLPSHPISFLPLFPPKIYSFRRNFPEFSAILKPILFSQKVFFFLVLIS